MLKSLILSLFFLKFNVGDEIFILNLCLNVLNDSLREVIVDEHNILRSQLALGQAIIKGGVEAAPAKNMYKLVSNFIWVCRTTSYRACVIYRYTPWSAKSGCPTVSYFQYYDCELEKSAQAWANECIWDHSDYEVGENLFMIGASNYDKLDTIIKASDDWWKELRHVGGITPTNTLYTRVLNNLRIGHWTQV